MSPLDDDQDVWMLPDDDLLTGEPVAGEPELTAFVSMLRATAATTPPAPSPALRRLLREGLAPGEVPESPAAHGPAPVVSLATGGERARRVPADRAARRRTRRLGGAAGLTLAAKLTLGAGVAAAAVTGAATVDGVPEAIQRPASAVVDGVLGLVRAGAPEQRDEAPGAGTSGVAPADGIDEPAPDEAARGSEPVRGVDAPRDRPEGSENRGQGGPPTDGTPGADGVAGGQRADDVRESLDSGELPGAADPQGPVRQPGPPAGRPVDPPDDVEPGRGPGTVPTGPNETPVRPVAPDERAKGAGS